MKSPEQAFIILMNACYFLGESPEAVGNLENR